MRIIIRHIALFIALVTGISSFAQDIKVSATIDSTSILIGNQAHLKLKAMYDNRHGLIRIQWPAIADSLASKVHVVDKSKVDTVIADSMEPTLQSQTQNITITGFDSGFYAIPPFQFIVNGDTAHPILTEPMMLQVRTVPVDTTKAFRDIKGPIQVKFPLILILIYVGIGLVALAIIIFVIIYFINRNKKRKLVPEVKLPPPVDPHVKALELLEQLALKKLWQEGKIKEYYSSVTDILRIYLNERFGVDALEMTTDEIMYAMRRVSMDEAIKIKLQQLLVLSDLVKFAKEQPLPYEHESTLNGAIDFVNNTAPRPETQPKPEPRSTVLPSHPETKPQSE